jgi:hypothetical protein
MAGVALTRLLAALRRHPVANPRPQPAESAVDRAWRLQLSDVQVQGAGRVARLLSDDNEGARHQRFILRLASGLTLLVAHNIDVAPRLAELRVRDQVSFAGEYAYSELGGTLHWTHHDPRGDHPDGWLEWRHRRFD